MIHINFTLSYIELYFMSINTIAFLVYGYDKLQALRAKKYLSRVSEVRLYLLSFIGGSIGAFIAMILFRHKIKKFSFMWKFIFIVILQIICLYYFKLKV